MKPRIAIVCDWLVSRGGAERVILELSDMFAEAPIYTALYDERKFPELGQRQVKTSFLQKIPLSLKKHAFLLGLMPYAFEQFDLSAFDIVISSSHSCAKGIITKPRTLHICYCHSPMRYVWDNCIEYFEQYGLPSLLKVPARNILHNLRLWDRLAADRVDFFIANSEHVRRRIAKYYRREATVIYPGARTEKFHSDKLIEGRYFLAVGRLAPYKRFDLLIDVFNDLQLPLIIVGIGKEEKKLKKQAGRFITFLGEISDDELRETYERAKALIFPQEEDFGITPLEAMSTGKPVIAYGAGGSLETVIPGKTGLFFMEQSRESLKRTILEFSGLKWEPDVIRNHAHSFSQEKFQREMRSFIENKWTIWRKEMAE